MTAEMEVVIARVTIWLAPVGTRSVPCRVWELRQFGDGVGGRVEVML